MAVVLAKLTRQRIFAAKVETTTGTAESLTAAEAVYNAYNHSMKEVSPSNERQGQSALSELPPVPGTQSGEYTWITELFGSGSGGSPAPTWATPLLKGAGFAPLTGNVYKPSTGQGATLTVGMFQAGQYKCLKGAALDLTITCEDGKPIQLEWKAVGNWVDPTDASLITPTYPTIIPPVFTGATITIGGTAYKIPSLKIELGNTLTLRPDADAATGFFAAMITEVKRKVTVSCEALALATKNWSTARKAVTSHALSCAIGSGAGSIITIACPAMYLIDPPNNSDKGGILYDDLVFCPARSAAAGDDEISITFS